MEHVSYLGVDLIWLISTFGVIGVTAIVFAETGLFLGFFLPGDSLLFVAGFLASQGIISLPMLLGFLLMAAITGNMVGYAFGRHIGPKIFTKEDSLLFKKSHVLKAQKFYEQYGAKTIMFARFVPIVRTFAPILAGVAKMNYGNFLFYNIAGAIAWVIGLVCLGYFLGKSIPNIDRYLLPIVLGIVVLSILPGVFKYLQERKKAKS